MKYTSIRRAAALALGLALTAGAAEAQPLPAASDLVAKYRAAIGGQDAFAKYQSMTMNGSFSMPAAGITAPFTAWSARPNHGAMVVSIPGFGDIRQGYDGQVAWSMNPMEGPRVLDGAELKQVVDDSDFDSSLRPMAKIASMETVELTKMGGQDCYKVRITWKSERVSHDCYSPETGLLVASVATQESNMGATEAVTLYNDYKDFGGITLPTRMTIVVMDMEQILSVSDITFDSVPEGTFKLPAEIQGLVKK